MTGHSRPLNLAGPVDIQPGDLFGIPERDGPRWVTVTEVIGLDKFYTCGDPDCDGCVAVLKLDDAAVPEWHVESESQRLDVRVPIDPGRDDTHLPDDGLRYRWTVPFGDGTVRPVTVCGSADLVHRIQLADKLRFSWSFQQLNGDEPTQ